MDGQRGLRHLQPQAPTTSEGQTDQRAVSATRANKKNSRTPNGGTSTVTTRATSSRPKISRIRRPLAFGHLSQIVCADFLPADRIRRR